MAVPATDGPAARGHAAGNGGLPRSGTPSESLPATLLVTASPRRVGDPRRRVLGDGQALGSEDPAAVGAGWGSHLHLLADPVAEQRLG